MPDPDFEAELDRIYSLPLAEFVTARGELAKRLRAAGADLDEILFKSRTVACEAQ